MAKLDFKTQEGKTKAKELVQDIFHDFDNVESVFTESGYGLTVRVDDCFEYLFTEDNLLQIKQLLWVLQMKKLDRLNSCKQV